MKVSQWDILRLAEGTVHLVYMVSEAFRLEPCEPCLRLTISMRSARGRISYLLDILNYRHFVCGIHMTKSHLTPLLRPLGRALPLEPLPAPLPSRAVLAPLVDSAILDRLVIVVPGVP